MTQEGKQLLLVDLSARLPYGVRGVYKTPGIEITSQKLTYDIIGNLEYKNNVEFKPYLFPMSSMTPKQKAELLMLVVGVADIFKAFLVEVEFYHRHHIDYRGLISMGLAIDATELNIY